MVEANYTDDMIVDTPNRVDNSDDDNWGDDDDDEWDMNDKEPDFVRIPSNTSASAGDFKTMHVNQIRTALMKKLDDAHDMFAMERDDMMIIIRHYKWNEDRMQQEWFDDQEKLQHKLGLVYDKKLDKDPQINVSLPSMNPDNYCLSCYEELTEENKYSLSCGHTFCIHCVKEHLYAKI